MFVGIRPLRVIIHEFSPEKPFDNKDFPETDYAHIGRARILHVFRDREESEELDEVPSENVGAPVLSGV